MTVKDSRALADPHAEAVERAWMDWLRALTDPRPALQVFVRHYHYFSLNQVVAFSRLLAAIPRTDRESMAVFAEVLFEELGAGSASAVHSILLERFGKAAGVNADELPILPGKVVSGVRWYVCELEMAFGGRSLPRALATYGFLETAAVATYGPLLGTLRACRFSEAELEFFARHSTVEVEHANAAQRLIERAKLSQDQRVEFDDQIELLDRCWRAFWQDIWDACREAYQ